MEFKRKLIGGNISVFIVTLVLTGAGFSLRRDRERYLEFENHIENSLADINLNEYNIFAHRADSSFAPDNSLEAIEFAINNDCATGVEIDVWMTEDEFFAIHHDKKIGHHIIEDTCFDEIISLNESHPYIRKSLPIKNYFFYNEIKSLIYHRAENFTRKNSDIPTILDIVDYQKEKPFLIDLKVTCDTDTKEWAKEFAPLTDCLDNPDNVYQSFNHELLQELRKLRPNLNYCILVNNKNKLEEYRYYYNRISMKHTLATEEVIERELNSGKQLFVWTMNSYGNLEKVVANSNGRQKEITFITKIPDVMTVKLNELEDLYPPVEENNKKLKKVIY